MNQTLVDNNYLVVPGFISKERAESLRQEFYVLERNGGWEKDHQAPNSPAMYNFKPFLELLCEKTPEVSSLIQETVLPTYCYARIYKGPEVLVRHRDRPACEVSFTLHLGGDAEWPIFIQKPDGTETFVDLKPGDAMLYLGCVAAHWREQYTGIEYAQVFMHYVRSNGPNAWAYFDRVK
jgi:hypothetical protein